LNSGEVYKQQDIEQLVQEKCKEIEINVFRDVQRTVRKLYREGKYFEKIKKGFYLFDENYSVSKTTGSYFSEYVKKKILERDGNICQLCGFEFPKNELVIDHITSYDKNGLGTFENGQVCCITCNNKKRNKENLEILKENYRKQKKAIKFLESKIFDKKF
jgi:hypothetical protein